MPKIRSLLAAAALLTAFAGCNCSAPADPEMPAPPVCPVTRTQAAIKVDGVLDEAAWQDLPAVQLAPYTRTDDVFPAGRAAAAKDPWEGAQFKLLYDDQYLYLGGTLTDGDVLAYKKEDQEHHYRYGDTVEIFLKPANDTYYWEFYVTPSGHTTSFFYPSAGSDTHECFSKAQLLPQQKAAAQVNGTLNDWQDTDRGWTAELAIPLKGLAQYGIQFAPGQPWTIQIARYNYGRNFRVKRLSSFPELPGGSGFHVLEYYAPIEFR